jgi:hypothetical protein
MGLSGRSDPKARDANHRVGFQQDLFLWFVSWRVLASSMGVFFGSSRRIGEQIEDVSAVSKKAVWGIKRHQVPHLCALLVALKHAID